MPLKQRNQTNQTFKGSQAGLKKFSFFCNDCLTKTKEPRLPEYLSITHGKPCGSLPFTRV